MYNLRVQKYDPYYYVYMMHETRILETYFSNIILEHIFLSSVSCASKIFEACVELLLPSELCYRIQGLILSLDKNVFFIDNFIYPTNLVNEILTFTKINVRNSNVKFSVWSFVCSCIYLQQLYPCIWILIDF